MPARSRRRSGPGGRRTAPILLRAFLPERSAAILAGDDEEIVAAVHADLARTIGLREAPIVRNVARWQEAMPRYTVGHLDRVAAAEAAMAARPEIVLAGAAFHGVGVPDCIARGRDAARRAIAGAGVEAGRRVHAPSDLAIAGAA